MWTRFCCGCQVTDWLMLIMQLLNCSVKNSGIGGSKNDNGVFNGMRKCTATSLLTSSTSHIKRSGSSDEGKRSKSVILWPTRIYFLNVLFIYLFAILLYFILHIFLYFINNICHAQRICFDCTVELERDACNTSFYFIQWVQWGWFFTCLLKETVIWMDEKQIRWRRGVLH